VLGYPAGMTDRAAIVDRAGVAAAAAAVAVCVASFAPGGAAAARAVDAPCVAAGTLAVLAPTAVVPQVVGPSLAAADKESIASDSFLDTTAGTGLSVGHIEIGVAGCAGSSGAPGGTSTRATALSVLGGAVKSSAVQVDLVPMPGTGAGWRLRAKFDQLTVDNQPLEDVPGATAGIGNWGVVDRPDTIDAGSGAPLRWWRAALELRLTRAHAGFAAGTRLLIGWASADRQPAASPPVPSPPVATPMTTTTTTTQTTTQPTESTPAPPAAPPSTTPKPGVAAKTPAVRKRVRLKPAAHHPKSRKKKRHVLPALLGQPLRATPSLGGGTYDFPVLGTASWGDTYGAERSDVPGGWHHGDDLFVALGTPVVAVTDGTVFAVGWNRVGGWRLWLEDARGNDFYYAHLAGYTKLARENNHVRRGQVLGFVGNTGDAFTTIPHLHFEVHPFGLLPLGYDGAVDPTRYLASWERPGGVDVLPPVPLPLPSFRGAGSLTDFRRLLALRPLARAAVVTRARPSLKSKRPHVEAAAPPAAAAAVSSSGGWGAAAAGAVLLVLAIGAVGFTARSGRPGKSSF
jgi:murein DD-endopeptidase MepM/ murein hydrolase activator NlpD